MLEIERYDVGLFARTNIDRFARDHSGTVLHRQTCPLCGKKLVNLYLAVSLDADYKWLCKNCIDKKLKEANNG